MTEWYKWSIDGAIALMTLAGLVSVASLIRFSSILIKLVVIEVITNLLLASIALWALVNNQPIAIDVCLTLALIMFLGVVAYYQYLYEKENSDAYFDQ